MHYATEHVHVTHLGKGSGHCMGVVAVDLAKLSSGYWMYDK